MQLWGTAAPGWSIHGTGAALSRTDRDKWDARYLAGAYEARLHPSALLADWAGRLEVACAASMAIDIACGAGRNALFLARRGWHVDAIDISAVALGRLRATAEAEDLPVICVERDLEPASGALNGIEDRKYSLALLIRYTDMPLVEALPRILAPGGYLIAEMHLQTDAAVAGPRSPRFRVAPGELRRAAAAFELLYYNEGLQADPDGRTVALAQLVGRRRALSIHDELPGPGDP